MGKKKTDLEENDFYMKDLKPEEITVDKSKVEELNGVFNENDYIDIPPDGGYGWLCCACVTIMNFATWGVNCGFGIFLSFYLENDVFPGATPTDYALVGGILAFLTLALIPYTSILLLKFGYKVTASIGILIQLAGYLGASFATTLVQFYITQGVLIGISYGIIFGANSIVLPSWFLRKRALANGISHFGIGLGGVVFTLIINKLIIETGDQKWALRIIGIISFVICTVTMFLVKIRIPQNSQFKD
ncbi:putative transporter [Wickerhamomyces ciferrii]|uniref:Transporter n=1 Tax=Wickerhamomyces ciferrii (strain ATCC 14091 / BCRC 22168 / CBS 111 / JCM 3599 / NBRC 0793 / NRRL Y-1031 F-60-10) TaxID=1206466 RepID=K0KQ27_WICCF|nr:putative transporter [Wickerhamomyces ciferrii]CCH43278.1 putative transporter [Wickerhamomyces ciferrii]